MSLCPFILEPGAQGLREGAERPICLTIVYRRLLDVPLVPLSAELPDRQQSDPGRAPRPARRISRTTTTQVARNRTIAMRPRIWTATADSG
jgi:hypothetical protein